jgi:hypothetical protein
VDLLSTLVSLSLTAESLKWGSRRLKGWWRLGYFGIILAADIDLVLPCCIVVVVVHVWAVAGIPTTR